MQKYLSARKTALPATSASLNPLDIADPDFEGTMIMPGYPLWKVDIADGNIRLESFLSRHSLFGDFAGSAADVELVSVDPHQGQSVIANLKDGVQGVEILPKLWDRVGVVCQEDEDIVTAQSRGI